MSKIEVKRKKPDTFEVTVQAGSTTSHTVTLDDATYQKLAAGKVSKEVLIEESFRFLLERESNTMILSRFDLPVIGRYFPEYERTIAKRL
jgi:hypothetical protein